MASLVPRLSPLQAHVAPLTLITHARDEEHGDEARVWHLPLSHDNIYRALRLSSLTFFTYACRGEPGNEATCAMHKPRPLFRKWAMNQRYTYFTYIHVHLYLMCSQCHIYSICDHEPTTWRKSGIPRMK